MMRHVEQLFRQASIEGIVLRPDIGHSVPENRGCVVFIFPAVRKLHQVARTAIEEHAARHPLAPVVLAVLDGAGLVEHRHALERVVWNEMEEALVTSRIALRAAGEDTPLAAILDYKVAVLNDRVLLLDLSIERNDRRLRAFEDIRLEGSGIE